MVVVEYGAAAMKSPQINEFLMKNLVLLSCVGLRMVLLVHGGRLEYNSCLEITGVEDKFTDGSSVTNEETVDFEKIMLMEMVNSFYGLFFVELLE
jgi:acetylglutamate kinase